MVFSSVLAGSATITFTFTVVAGTSFRDGQVSLTIPRGWTEPETGDVAGKVTATIPDDGDTD